MSGPGRRARIRRLAERLAVLFLLVEGLEMFSGCHSQQPAAPPKPESAAACAERQRSFAEFVAELPSRAVASPTRVELPLSRVGAAPGGGRLVEIAADLLVLDGEVVPDADREARIRRFEGWVKDRVTEWGETRPASGATRAKAEKAVLYVAASADLEMQVLRSFLVHVPETVELRLLVRMAAPEHSQGRAHSEGGSNEVRGEPEEAQEIAGRLLGEPEGQRRGQIAAEGYARFADCAAMAGAVASISSVDAQQRWPALQSALEKAVPACECGKLDTTSLRLLVSAEQRAGAAALGWLPLSFLHDERCDASMPLRSVKKLVKQIEAFDEEFAGDFRRDAVEFGDVVVSDRLRVYFCNALPGETLAAKERAHATLYFRSSERVCEAFQFAPSSPGAPTGTFALVESPSSGARTHLAFHYWQAAEEVRVFGPIDSGSPSKPTDERDWPCEETFRLTGIDEHSVHLETGRWFFDEASCLAAREDVRLSGCVTRRAAGSE
jgi:hypothetical protein